MTPHTFHDNAEKALMESLQRYERRDATKGFRAAPPAHQRRSQTLGDVPRSSMAVLCWEETVRVQPVRFESDDATHSFPDISELFPPGVRSSIRPSTESFAFSFIPAPITDPQLHTLSGVYPLCSCGRRLHSKGLLLNAMGRSSSMWI